MDSMPDIALALGSGSARGWAHIGVIHALHAAGIYPDIYCGTSTGALVAAAHLSGNLDDLEAWLRTLTWWDIARFMDLSLRGGGFIEGERLMEHLNRYVADVDIESLPGRFASVATELATGHEIWFQEGSLRTAVRASISLPGLFAPVKHQGQWLADGGLVNPVPVSVCRALGARIVIAVDLNADIVGRHLNTTRKGISPPAAPTSNGDLLDQLWGRLNTGLRATASWLPRQNESDAPGLFAVLAGSINIMQDRITRARMAGDPPEVLLAPQLSHLALLDFGRAAEAIEEGKACVENALPEIEKVLANEN